jgi:lysophospholipase L1-like esterase
MIRLRAVLERTALVVFGVGVALGVAEVVARVTAPTPAAPAPRKPSVDPERSTVEWSVFDFLKPHVRAFMPSGALYRTNRHGFRGREYAARKPAGVFRVVIVGDSVTMGSGVEEDEAYPALLEPALNAEAAGKAARYEVLNLGVPGAHLGFVVTRLEGLGLRFDPDLIVYGWTVNDIEGDLYRKTMPTSEEVKRRRQAFQASPFASSALVRVVLPHWRALREGIRPPPESYVHELRWNYFHNAEAWADFSAGLDRLARVQEERSVCVAVFLHTHLKALNFLYPFRTIHRRVQEAARERGLLVIDSFHAHRGRSARPLWVDPTNLHPNPRGHRILGEALFEGLTQAPRPCWRGSHPIEEAERARP